MLMKALTQGEVIAAKMVQEFTVVTAVNNKICFFDIRKPALVLKELQINLLSNRDEINDVDLIRTDCGVKIASCDDSGAGLITTVTNNFEVVDQRWLDTKHTNSCYRIKFSNPDVVLTAGFDYKICLWNLKDSKKSMSSNMMNLFNNELGAQAVPYNPPFVYSWATYYQGQSEKLILGHGNGMITKFNRKGLSCEQIHGELHST